MQAQVYLEGHRGRKSELAGHGLRKQVAEAKEGPWSFGGGGGGKGTHAWGGGRNGHAPKGEPPKDPVLTSQEKCFQNERR